MILEENEDFKSAGETLFEKRTHRLPDVPDTLIKYSEADGDDEDEDEDIFGLVGGDEELEGDMVDTQDEDTIPEDFLFESRMIFVSNLAKVPPAVGDRCLTIQLTYTKEQALQLIESKLEGLCPQYPELKLKDKKEIIKVMKKYQKVTPRFSFRMFEKCAVLFMSGDPDWEKWCMIQLRSMGSLT